MIVAVALVGILAVPGRAQAHPTLLFTTPAADTAEAVSPSAVVLVFNEPVTVGAAGLVVLDAVGRQIAVDRVTTAREGRAVTGRIAQALLPGVYTLRWRVTGSDGDLVESSFRFAVGAAIIGESASQTPAGTAWPVAGLRWLLFAGLALALGGTVGARITASARAVRASLPRIRPWIGLGAAVGLAASLGMAMLLAVDAGVAGLLSSQPGRVALVEAAAFAAPLALTAGGGRRWIWVPLLAVPVAEGVRSHAERASPGWGGLATAVHLAAAAVWVGALAHVVRAGVTWRAQRPALMWVVTGYARWAAWLLATVVLTGAVSAVILVPWSGLTTTAYGRTLLVKLALVALAATAALTARWLLRNGTDATHRVALATRVEAGTLTAVLAVTAALVSTPPAREAQQFLVPPPPTGVVLPLATLAGQVGVAVAASDGQLVVRLSTPRRDNYYTPGEASSYRLAAAVLPPGGDSPTELRLGGCGEGCFVAPVGWGSGENLVTLRVLAAGWTGGTVGLVVAWPVTPAPERLARAVEAMRAAGEIIVHEAGTSDTSAPWPEPIELRLSGAEFVATEPYSSGVAPQVVLVRADDSGSRLAVGFPAEGRYVELVLDRDGRIVEESLADAKHLTRRRFVYADQR